MSASTTEERSESAETPPRRPESHRFLGGLVAASLFLIAVVYAFYTVFAQPLGQDEGYLMITVQSFLQGQPLYDVVFTQYGPVYYVYEWFLHQIFQVPLTHDATRWVCIVHWLGAAALLSVAGRIMTRSLLGGLLAFMQAVIHLSPLTREAGHPQELIALLLAIGVLAIAGGPQRNSGFWILGGVAAALLFIKANIGIFFGAALFLTAYFHSDRSRSGASGRTWLLIAVCALLPFLLMRRHVMHDWCRNYSFLTAIVIVAAALTARDTAANILPWRRWVGAVVAFGMASLVFAAIALATGTSLTGLFDGLLLTPLKTPDIAVLPFRVHNAALISAGTSLAVAVLVSATIGHARREFAVVILKLIFVAVSAFVLIGKSQLQLMYVLPWVWLAAVLPANGAAPEARFPRVFLCLAAGWQSLQAYPVAGTQVAIGSLLLTLATTVCLLDVLAALRVGERLRVRAESWPPNLVSAGRVLAALALVCSFAWLKLPAARANYSALPRLDLRGSALVRSDAQTVQIYQSLARYLEANCDTFITCPGMNSFYFWTAKPPPTHLNPTTLSILTAAQQRQIMDALRRAERPLIVILESIVRDPGRRGSASIRVLLQAIRDEYVEVHDLPPFKIYAPKRSRAAQPSPPATGNP